MAIIKELIEDKESKTELRKIVNLVQSLNQDYLFLEVIKKFMLK